MLFLLDEKFKNLTMVICFLSCSIIPMKLLAPGGDDKPGAVTESTTKLAIPEFSVKGYTPDQLRSMFSGDAKSSQASSSLSSATQQSSGSRPQFSPSTLPYQPMPSSAPSYSSPTYGSPSSATYGQFQPLSSPSTTYASSAAPAAQFSTSYQRPYQSSFPSTYPGSGGFSPSGAGGQLTQQSLSRLPSGQAGGSWTSDAIKSWSDTSSVGGDGEYDNPSDFQSPAVQLDVSKLSQRPQSSALRVVMPTPIPAQQGVIGRIFNPDKTLEQATRTNNTLKGQLASQKISDDYKDKFITYKGEQIPYQTAVARINDAETLAKLLDKMVNSYNEIENLFQNLSGKLVADLEKQRLNAEETVRDFMDLFNKYKKYETDFFNEDLSQFQDRLSQMFTQVLEIYGALEETNSEKIEQMNKLLSVFSESSRALRQKINDVLKLQESRTLFMRLRDELSAFSVGK